MRTRAPILLRAACLFGVAAVAWCVVFWNDRAAWGDSAAPAGSVQSAAANLGPLVPGAVPGDQGPSSVIFPVQAMPLRFDHASHASRSIPCVQCHSAARTSDKASDRILPSPAVCDRCHGGDHDRTKPIGAGAGTDGGCAYCHVGFDPAHPAIVPHVLVPEPQLKFSHRAHSSRNIGCGQCHGGVQRAHTVGRERLPRMRGCFACHNLPAESRGEARAECDTCHLAQLGGRLKTHLATGTLRPPRWLGGAEHGPDFVSRHKRAAGDHSRLCAACHTEESCTDCHDGRLRPRNVHPNDFLSMHPIAARQNSPRCSSCHHAQSFCQTCHLRAGVTQSGSPANRQQQGRFHPPPEQFTSGPRTPRHHAWEAQRNLSACVSCHTERDCATCHASGRAGGVGVNPHPAGFLARCASAFSRNPRPCLVCHEPGDPVLGSCR